MRAAPGSRREYFQAIAPRWEGLVDAARARKRLEPILRGLGIGPHEQILDLGCGPGILTELLLDMLSARGRVIALDFADAMLDLAIGKIDDRRVLWMAADASSIPLPDAAVDRAVAFSTWPHFPDPASVLLEIRRTLRPGGAFHIIHVDGRATINAIHSGAAKAIAGDALRPACEVAAMISESGFRTITAEDSSERFIVTALREDVQ